MSHVHIERLEDAAGLEADLTSADRFALDCEAAGFHRYSDRLCLIQITANGTTYVVDPIAFDPSDLVRPAIEDPDKPVLMHGADFDLRLLKRDLGIRLRGLVDTQISASLLGVEGLGLASLLETRLGVKLSKKFQRADWASRPLSEGMLGYAASDTRHLAELTDLLIADLRDADRLDWAREEWEALEEVADETPDDGDAEVEDPVVRVKGARRLPVRQVAALREALQWRDEIARDRDRAPFRVIGDQPLIAAAMNPPRRVEDLLEIKGFPKALAREEGKTLLGAFRRVAEAEESDLVPFPKNYRRGPGRPPPELEPLVDRLKGVRNQKAEEVGLPRGTLMSNAVILGVARAAPPDMDALLKVEGMRQWKAEVAGEALLEALRRG